MKRACGCCDETTAEPRLIYETRNGGQFSRRLQHECGTKWWQHETLGGEETHAHVDR